MSKRILKKGDSVVKVYPKYANPLSLLANHSEAYQWIMNCFIQITSYNDLFLDYYDFNYRNCPFIECQRIKLNTIFSLDKNMKEFIVSSINNGYFVYLEVNEKYISIYKTDIEKMHDLFIYGYDLSNNLVYITDYFLGKYSNNICSFNELYNSIINISEQQSWFNGFNNCIELLSFKDEKRACFELYRVIESIDDYLNSTPTTKWFESYEMWNSDENVKRRFGIECYKTLINHNDIAVETGEFTSGSTQAFYLIWEHKKNMIKRLQFIREKGMWIDDNLIEQFKKIENELHVCLLLKLKYDITKNKQILEKIKRNCNEIAYKEANVLFKIQLNLKSDLT